MKRTPLPAFSTRTALVLAFACIAAGVLFSPPAGGLGKQGELTLSYDKKVLSLRKGGAALWSRSIDPPGKVAAFSSASHELSGGVIAWHATLTLEGDRTFEVAVVTSLSGNDPEIVFARETTLRGDPSERFGPALRFFDLSGDGLPELVVGVVSERVRLCGVQALPVLERRAFDPTSKELRPVLARRDTPLVGGDIFPKDPPELDKDAPQLTPATLVSVSSVDEGAARSPARALADDDAATYWAPRFRSGAGGEAATFAIDARVYPLSFVGLRLPADAEDRLTSVILTTEEGAVRLRLDPGNGGSSTWRWFELSPAKKTRCFSLVFEKTSAPLASSAVPIADVKAVTLADAPGFETTLAADLGVPEKRDEAQRLLKAMGKRGVDAVQASFDALNSKGRLVAVEFLASTDPEGSLGILVEFATRHGGNTPPSVRDAVKAAGPAALEFLLPLLQSEDPDRFGRAVALVASTNSDEAFDALLALHAGDETRRKHLRAGLAAAITAKPARGERVAALLEGDDPKDAAWEIDLIRTLAAVPESADRAARIATEKIKNTDDFGVRYHLLRVLQKTGCDRGVELRLAAVGDTDPWVRETALASLSSCLNTANPEHRRILKTALEDPAVPVRQAALDAVQEIVGHPDLAGAVTGIAMSDPWPHLRAFALEKASELPPQRFAPILKDAADSAFPMLREKAIRIAAKLSDPASAQVIKARLEDPDETPNNLKLAAFAAADRCLTDAAEALFEVLVRGAQPLPPPELIFTAVAAAKALGTFGTEEAKKFLEKAKRRSNLVTDRAIKEALERKEPGCISPPPGSPSPASFPL